MPAQSGRIVVGGKAVDDEAVGEIALAADRNALPGHGGGLGEKLVARGVGGRDAGHQQREIQEVAAVERQACTSACDTVPAICVRAVSITDAFASTVTALCAPATVSAIARSNAEPTVSVTARRAGENPGWLTVTSYAPTLR